MRIIKNSEVINSVIYFHFLQNFTANLHYHDIKDFKGNESNPEMNAFADNNYDICESSVV